MRQMYFFRVLFTLALVSVCSVSCKKNPVEQDEAVAPMEAASMLANRVEHAAYNPMLAEPHGFGAFKNPYADYEVAIRSLGMGIAGQGKMDIESIEAVVESVVPEGCRTLSAESVDRDVVEQVLRILPGLEADVSIDVYLKRLQLVEYEVFNSKLLSPNNEDFILKYVALLKGAYEVVLMQQGKNWGGRWKDCMRDKLKDMQDLKSPVETFLCLADWPTCFAAMMADCAIEASKQTPGEIQ